MTNQDNKTGNIIECPKCGLLYKTEFYMFSHRCFMCDTIIIAADKQEIIESFKQMKKVYSSL